ncbi:MAG TPA: ATP-binding cassette domain-containing protein [Gammaproteobacteria bacterium]|jgi:tungstate transport system ATP-binding protein|nr:ABC transporter ATP-binding protein [Gammaproteobacteria bacterium]HBK77387.1 ABC transporter ATP-binding protein [Gammaproteobacteria bacterium]HHZ73145.1 ATP-binding cassette domain-containing protein [Gammaproteobacteria bacterium]HIA40740.1 ATP-binding cassette domain-containing protein [Gammaproteobacteria bacterium]HIB06603.1 ATP-binding cassette domain-containing protein [Gammaproteobacteria bacterium]
MNQDPVHILPLVVDGLGFSVREQWLIKDVSFSLGARGRTFIVGPNGAGKSILLRLCHGLLSPTTGTVRWASGSSRQQRQRQAMVFQKPVLFRRSARANVEYALSVRGVAKKDVRQRADDALEATGLTGIAHRQARVLSGGEQQRLVLARAWALRPRVLFLDEPAAHLDPAATAAIEDVIEQISNAGSKIIMVTHDLGQVRRLADEVLFLHQGQLLEQTASEDFLTHAKTQEARAFVEGQLLW